MPLFGRGGGWHKASVSDCLPLAAPIGLSPLLILTLCGPERVLVVSGGGLGCISREGTSEATPHPFPPRRKTLFGGKALGWMTGTLIRMLSAGCAPGNRTLGVVVEGSGLGPCA